MTKYILICLLLLLPALGWAQQQPVIYYFPDQAVVKIDVTGLYAARGTITRDVKFANPEGNAWDLQPIYIDVYSDKEQNVEWDSAFKPGFGYALPTKTTAKVKVRWGFVYDARQRVWDHLGNTQAPKLPAP